MEPVLPLTNQMPVEPVAPVVEVHAPPGERKKLKIPIAREVGFAIFAAPFDLVRPTDSITCGTDN